MGVIVIMDALAASIQLLKDDGDVAALVSDAVFGEDIPRDDSVQAPSKALVLQHATGSSGPGGFVELQSVSFTVFAYGATPEEAMLVYMAAYKALKYANRVVKLETLLHSFTQVGSPTPRLDADTQSPLVEGTWQALASEKQAT